MRILLIGGTGLLSLAIAKRSLQLGYDVYLLNRGRRRELIPPGAILLKADIHNRESVNSSIGNKNFDVVVDFLSYREEQLLNTLTLLSDHCLQYIFISSCAVYNKPDPDGYFRETSELGNEEWSYGRNKLKCERLLKRYMDNRKQHYTIIRPSITYGNTRIPYHIMPAYGWHWSFVERIRSGKPIPYWNGGNGKTTVTHVCDFAKGAVGLFMNDKAYGEAFHITSDNVYTWKEIAMSVGNGIGVDVNFVDIPKNYFARVLPMYRGMILGSRSRNAMYNNDKIKRVVPDFKCEVDLSNGIARTIEYYKQNHFLNGIDYLWDSDMDYLVNKYYMTINKHIKYSYVEYLPGDSERGAMDIYNKRQYRWTRFVIQFKSKLKRLLNIE